MIKSICMALSLCVGLPALAADSDKLTEAQVTETLSTINEGEIDLAETAIKHSTSAEVREFAKKMAAEHKKNDKEIDALAKSNKIGSDDSTLSDKLEDEAETMNKDLKKANKDAFDVTYLNQQVAMHEKALSVIDGSLLPATTNAALKAHLEKTRVAVNTHLNHAKELQAKIK